MAELLIVGSAIKAIGGIAGAAGEAQAAEAESDATIQAADYRAKQLKREGTEKAAAAQRVALDKQREGELVMSRQAALAAPQGGLADNPSLLDIFEDTAVRRDVLTRTEIAKGESARRGYLDQAAVARVEAANKGAAMKRAAKGKFYGSIFEGVGALGEAGYKYGQAKGYG